MGNERVKARLVKLSDIPGISPAKCAGISFGANSCVEALVAGLPPVNVSTLFLLPPTYGSFLDLSRGTELEKIPQDTQETINAPGQKLCETVSLSPPSHRSSRMIPAC